MEDQEERMDMRLLPRLTKLLLFSIELGLVPRLRVALPSPLIPNIDPSVAPVGNSDVQTGAYPLVPRSYLVLSPTQRRLQMRRVRR